MARLADQIIGHESQIAQLIGTSDESRLPQAMLFVGPSGIGKKTLAFALAQKLVCESIQKPCGLCGPCLRIEKKQSESLFFIEPDPEYAKPAIKVEDIRKLLEQLALAPIGRSRVVIIDAAHLMNDQASNALLKTLEEPSPQLYFILVANEEQLLLQTIQSRVQTIRLHRLSYDQLRSIKPNLPDWSYRSCRGQLDRLELLTAKQGLLERTEAYQILEEFCFNDEMLLFNDWRKAIKEDREVALFNIQCWIQILRDAVILKSESKQYLLNTDQIELLKKLYEVSVQKLIWLTTQLIQSARDIKGNQDAVLIFESLKVKYARLD